jgi:ubiquinone/menaquinone biosynthesis C-methylase UbiE
MAGDSLEEYYRARAPEYEQIYYRDNPVRRAEIDAEAKRLAELVSGKTVLELACGTGYWTRVMAQTSSHITASDIAPEALVEAKKKQFHCDVTFVEADMFAHSFGENAFDLVALGFWFSHHPRQEYDRLFDILTGPLKKNGLIWMIDNNPPAEGSTEMSCHVDEFGNNYKRRYLSDGRPFVILKNYFSHNDLEEIMRCRLTLCSLVYGQYYWSVVLQPQGTD